MWLNQQRHNNLDVPVFIRYEELSSRRTERTSRAPSPCIGNATECPSRGPVATNRERTVEEKKGILSAPSFCRVLAFLKLCNGEDSAVIADAMPSTEILDAKRSDEEEKKIKSTKQKEKKETQTKPEIKVSRSLKCG